MVATFYRCKIFYAVIVSLLFFRCQRDTKVESETAEPTDKQKSETSVPQDSTTNIPYEAQASDKLDVYSLGWSKDGKVLAYRSFFLSLAISKHSYFNTTAIDIVSDKAVWNFDRSWDDGNSGEELADPSPDSGAEVWNKVSNEVLNDLNKIGINPPSDPALHESYSLFPLQLGEDEFNVELLESEADYKVIVVSKLKGKKTVFTKRKKPEDLSELNVLGYFLNPQQNRMAILVTEFKFAMNINEYYTTGCLLTSGFGESVK